MKRLVSFFLAGFLAYSLVIPVYASDSTLPSPEGVLKQPATFSQWMGTGFQTILGFSFGMSCPNSEDGYHYATSYLDWREGEAGNIEYHCQCSACGKLFTAYESDLQQSYNAQVAELPAPGYDSSGALRWRLNVNHSSATGDVIILTESVGTSFSVYAKNDSRTSGNIYEYIDSFIAPVSGTYQLYVFLESQSEDLHLVGNSDCYFFRDSSSRGHLLSKGESQRIYTSYLFPVTHVYVAGETIFSSNTEFRIFVSPSSAGTAVGYWELSCVPVTPPSGDTYNIQSRPTSITGDYGIIGDNGQITQVDGDYIVNETTNTYHNPATGTTTPIVDWSYDYGDRAYTLSLEGGLGVTVKYGDENITIDESTVNDSGDTITNNYTIYYLVNGSGTEDPDPSPSPSPSNPPACDHTWTETSRTEPTCISAGKVTSTCSKCNQTKTETIPATGHTWVVERTVQTTYDDSGNLLQQGYTIYMCSVCGEQYKDVDGTGPPGGGCNDDSDSGVISEIIAKLKAIYDEISETVQGFFGQFTDFLKAVFPFLPEEFFTILLLGALLMVIVAALRKLIS